MPRGKKQAEQPNQRQPSAAELAARARGLKGNAEMAEQFGVNSDYVRELVKVDYLPDPPLHELPKGIEHPKRKFETENVDLNQVVLAILNDAADEVTVRLERFNIPFTPAMRQDMIDHLTALLSLSQQGMMVGGGAVARR